MIRTLTVFYLHKPGRFDAKRLPVIEYGLTDAFRDFCRETFDVRGSLDYPPMKLVTVHDAPTLAKALFTSGGPRGVLTELGRACCLFLIDDDLMKMEVEGLSLRSWLGASGETLDEEGRRGARTALALPRAHRAPLQELLDAALLDGAQAVRDA